MRTGTKEAGTQEQRLSILALQKRLRSLVKGMRKSGQDGYFRRRGDGFSMRGFTYNPKTATEDQKAAMIEGLKRALQIVSADGG